MAFIESGNSAAGGVNRLKKAWGKVRQVRLENLLFYLFLINLPFQTRLVYFTSGSFIHGTYIFYDTIFVFLSDILLGLCVLIWLVRGGFHTKHLKIALIFLVFVFWIALSLVVNSDFSINSLLAFARIFFLWLFLCFILNTVSVKHMFHKIFNIITVTAMFELILAILQYIQQKSIGFGFLGEEYLRPYLSGIAKFQPEYGEKWIFDQLFHVYHETTVIRPYGTFPHPNVLGSFFVAAVLMASYLYLSVSRENLRKLMTCIIFAEFIGVILSFSRVDILALLLSEGIFILLLFRMKQPNNTFHVKQLAKILLFSAIISGILFFPEFLERGRVVSHGTANIEAVSDRVLYQGIALKMIEQHPVFGVGLQRFVDVMPAYAPVTLKDFQHQPVHNIYLLIAAEGGVPALGFFLFFLGYILYRAWRGAATPLVSALSALFVGFLFMGLFDHYFLTLQQGRLEFFLVSGLLLGSATLEPDVEQETFFGHAISAAAAGENSPITKSAL